MQGQAEGGQQVARRERQGTRREKPGGARGEGGREGGAGGHGGGQHREHEKSRRGAGIPHTSSSSDISCATPRRVCYLGGSTQHEP